MARRARRNFTAEFKAKVVLELISGQRSQAELCRKHQLNPTSLTSWKQTFLERLPLLFGEEDQNPSPADVATIEAELKKHGKTHEFHLYPGCGHGFHCDGRPSYRPEAAKDAWGKAIAWFDKHLKG